MYGNIRVNKYYCPEKNEVDLMAEEHPDEFDSSSIVSTFKDVVLTQLLKLNNLCNVEFRGGYYTTVPTKGGEEKEVYVQDSREVFSNAVLALRILLEPRFDKVMKPNYLKFKTELKKIQEAFIEDSSVEEEVILTESFYKNEEDRILLETYKMKKLQLYINLFSNLSFQLFRLNYLGISGGTFE